MSLRWALHSVPDGIIAAGSTLDIAVEQLRAAIDREGKHKERAK